jgi:hypothetical protein
MQCPKHGTVRRFGPAIQFCPKMQGLNPLAREIGGSGGGKVSSQNRRLPVLPGKTLLAEPGPQGTAISRRESCIAQENRGTRAALGAVSST